MCWIYNSNIECNTPNSKRSFKESEWIVRSSKIKNLSNLYWSFRHRKSKYLVILDFWCNCCCVWNDYILFSSFSYAFIQLCNDFNYFLFDISRNAFRTFIAGFQSSKIFGNNYSLCFSSLAGFHLEFQACVTNGI